MSSIFNGNIQISIFGESHGKLIGAVLDNIPAGKKINTEEITFQMSRRAPLNNDLATQRQEDDIPEIVSGILNNYTTGAPICAMIKNKNPRHSDYKNILKGIRPGHADYTSYIKYSGFNDLRGGGHLSGRLTAAITFCGAVCRQILEQYGVVIGSHIYSIYDIYDSPFLDGVDDDLLLSLNRKKMPVIDKSAKEKMLNLIQQMKSSGNSIGGIIECEANNVPIGLGEPIFNGVENKISSLIFAIPGVKGIEFGAGFQSSSMTGKEHNDEFIIKNKKIITKTNNHGGILGGITSGMPIIFRCAIKPTPSILLEQNTVDVTAKQSTKLSIKGRHDPCIVLRAAPIIEAVASIALLDFFKGANLL